MTERVRGRWTPEQITFIKRLAKEQKAAAADVIRHVAAWWLENADQAEQVTGRNRAPSPEGLMKRETGLKLLDFVTTRTQAQAIKLAAGSRGEAAFLRQAMDAYKQRGPLVKQKT